MPTLEERPLTWSEVAAMGIVAGVKVNCALFSSEVYLTLMGRKEDEKTARKLRDLQRQVDDLSQQAKQNALNELRAGGARIEQKDY